MQGMGAVQHLVSADLSGSGMRAYKTFHNSFYNFTSIGIGALA